MSQHDLEKTHRRETFIGVLVAMLLSSLAGTIISTAMPKILADLHGIEEMSWALTAYLLASTLIMPIVGKFADQYGRKPFYIGGIVIFVLGVLLSGFSTTMTQFVIFRAVSGLGGGIMQAIAMTIIADLFPPAERGKYQGILMSVFGLASVIGPLLGGWISDNMSWSWVFWVNVPLGVVAIVVLLIGMPAVSAPGASGEAAKKTDFLGISFLILAFGSMLLAFSWAGSKYDWGSAEILGLLAFSLVTIGIFIFVESRVSNPLVPLDLFKSGVFNVSVITGFLMMIGLYGSVMYMPMYIQGVVGQSATNSGITMAPMMIALILSSTIGGQIVSRTGRYKLIAILGFAVMLAGEILLATLSASTDLFTVSAYMIVMGLGLGAVMPVFVVASQSAFPHSRVGVVTSTLQFFRSIGMAFGISLMGSVMNTSFHDQALSALPKQVVQLIPADKLQMFLNPQVLFSPQASAAIKQQAAAIPGGDQLFAKVIGDVKGAFAGSIDKLFFVSSIIIALAFLVTFFLKEIPLRGKSPVPEDTSRLETALRTEEA